MPFSLPDLRDRLAELYPGTDPLTPGQLTDAYHTLAAETETVLAPHYLDARGMFEFFGPVEGETLLAGLAAAAESNPVLARGVGWLNQLDIEGRQGGVNLGGAATRGMIQSLTPTLFSAEQATALLALGEAQRPLWPGLTVELMERARALETE